MPLHLATLGHTLFALIGLLAYVLVTRGGRQRRHPSAALGWVIAILALPYVALPLFLMIGGRKLPRPARPPSFSHLRNHQDSDARSL